MQTIRILVVDDHPIVRQGIRSLLSNYAEFKIVAEADSGTLGLKYFRQYQPDVTLLDIRMPDQSGLEVLHSIRQQQAEARVLMLTSFDNDEYVIEALRAGARGYVLKSVSDEVLVNAIRAVHDGEHILSPQVTGTIVQKALSNKPPTSKAASDFDEEEQQLLKLLAEGASNTDIAEQLYVSRTTVKRKLRKIYDKLNVQSRAQAVGEAIRRGFV